MSCTSINAHMDMSERGLSRCFESYVSVAHGLTAVKKCIGEASLHLQLEMNTSDFLNFPKQINLNNWGQVNVRAVPLKLGHIWTSFLILLRRTYFWNVPKHCGYTLYPGITLITSELRLKASAGKPICPLSLFFSCWYETYFEKWKIMNNMLGEKQAHIL